MAGKKKKSGLLKVGLIAGLVAGVACLAKALTGAPKKTSKKKKK